jgi:putative PIN family toxin of toxin-antitoxin system
MDKGRIRDIVGDMMVVIDTNVLVAGLMSRRGASHLILRGIALDVVDFSISVPLYLEYEDVLKRPGIIRQTGLSAKDIDMLLDLIAEKGHQTPLHFSWKPQLRDAKDEMVLEAATNGGAQAIITFNQRDFLPASSAFDISIISPCDYLATIRERIP